MVNTSVTDHSHLLDFLLQFPVPLLIFSLPLFCFKWSGIHISKKLWILFGAAGSISMLLFILSGLMPRERDFLFQLIPAGLMAVTIIYSSMVLLVSGLKKWKNGGRPLFWVGITGLLLLPGFVYFDLYAFAMQETDRHTIFPVVTVPLFNLVFNVFLLYDIMKNSFHHRSNGGRSLPLAVAGEQFGLTKREQDVLVPLVEGKSYNEIGEVLFISSTTVKTHVLRIYEKFSVSGKMELVQKLLELR